MKRLIIISAARTVDGQLNSSPRSNSLLRASRVQLNSGRCSNSLFCRIFSLSSGSHLIVRYSSRIFSLSSVIHLIARCSGLACVLFSPAAFAAVEIGVAGPITGPFAEHGEQMKLGAEMAVRDINAAGGVNGEKLILNVADDACDPKQAVTVANQLASKGVKFVAGHFCSGSTIPASKVYEEEEIVQLSPASTNASYTLNGGWNVGRYCGNDAAQGKIAADYILKNYAGQRVAVVDDKSAYGKSLADVVRGNLDKANFPIAISESYNPGEKDYTALVSKLKEAGVTAIYIGGYHPEGGIIARQMGEQGLTAQILSGDAMNNLEFITIAGKAGESMMFTGAPDARNLPEAKTFMESFKTTGREPEGYALYTYATVQGYAAASTATKSSDSRKIAEWLRAGNPVDTIIGTVALDSKGDIKDPKYIWYRYKDGKFAEVPAAN